METQGIVEKIHAKSGQGKKGPWTRYSALINGEWYVVGFNKPSFNEGDSVSVTYEETQYGKEIKGGKILQKGTGTPPAAAGAASSGSTYNPSDRDRGMQWGNASNVAATLLCKMVDADALVLSTAEKGQAKRQEQFMNAFNKIRVELYQDSQDIDRVLDKVTDSGAVKENPPQPLPEEAPVESPVEEEINDEFESF